MTGIEIFFMSFILTGCAMFLTVPYLHDHFECKLINNHVKECELKGKKVNWTEVEYMCWGEEVKTGQKFFWFMFVPHITIFFSIGFIFFK